MEPLPRFLLFPEPLREKAIEASTEACDVCGRARGHLCVATPYSPAKETDDLKVCPWCIADGSAGALGLTFNDPTIYPYAPSTPQMSPADREMVERRTPGFVTWQGNHWMMCCGRACVYLGEADSSDLRGRWASAVSEIFGKDRPPVKAEEMVASVRRGGAPAAYVFQCQYCGKLTGYWDRD